MLMESNEPLVDCDICILPLSVSLAFLDKMLVGNLSSSSWNLERNYGCDVNKQSVSLDN